jgi:hemolysin activation/secretion protein
VLLYVGLILTVLMHPAAWAQQSLRVDPTGRSGERRPPLLEEQPPRPPPPWVLPPPPLPPPEKSEHLPLPRAFVREIRLTGNTAISAQEVATVTAPYVNRDLTSEDLEALRLALTRYYINKGYINSGAIIPDQTVTNGVITLRMIEGELNRIEVTGNSRLRPSYIQKRLALDAGPPVNLYALQRRLQLLQQDPLIQRLNAELSPGVGPGDSILHVRVDERLPYSVWMGFNNYQSPTVGAERGLLSLEHRNLTGYGDSLSVTYAGSEGVNPEIDSLYTFPITARDTTVSLEYRKNDFTAVEAPFDPLDIDSRSDIYGLIVRHPVYRTPNQEIAFVLTGERLESEQFLLGTPFSFAPGVKNGKSRITAARLALEWIDRSPTQVIAARSRFSVGLDVWNATTNRSSLPDGRFFAWLGQFQWARRLAPWDIQTLLRMDLQLASEPLLPLEQIAVGGRFTVRGYRENTLVRDNAFVGSLEAGIPVIGNRWWADMVQLVPFVDFGTAWNTTVPTPSPRTLASVGVGLRWAVTIPRPIPLTPQFEIYWGLPLRHVPTPGGNLQDLGVHLQFAIAAF